MEPTTALLIANVVSTFANVVNARSLQKRNLAAQEKSLRETYRQQKKLARANHAFQAELARQSRETQFKLQENQRALDGWPLLNTPGQITQYDDLRVPPLTVLLSPLHLKYDRLINAQQAESGIDESAFTEQVRMYISRWYPLHDATRPVQFMGAAWRSKAIREEAAVHSLFFYLKHHATLFLESGRAANEVVFRVSYWSSDDEVPRIETIALVPLKGQTIESLAGDLAAMNALFAAVISDIHHLAHSGALPVAPRLLAQLVRDVGAPEFAEAVRKLLDLYVVAGNSSGIGPQLAVDVAGALAAGGQKTAATEHLHRSLTSWMNLRGVRTRDGEDAIAFVLEHAGVQDRAYLESLGRCLELLGRKEDAARLGTVARSLPQLPSPDVKDEWT